MKRILYITALLLGTFLAAYAQESRLTGVKVIDEKVEKQGREVKIKLLLDLSELKVTNQQSVRILPVVVAKQDVRELSLAPIVADGKTRHRIHRRQKTLAGASPATDSAYTVLRRHNHRKQQVDYTATLTYEPWMAQSRLVLREETTGCLDCAQGGAEQTVRTTFLQLFRPHYATPFVQPEKEPVKRRAEMRTARLHFRQDSHIIDPKFKNNRAQLDTVICSIEAVKENTDLTITGIHVTGHASPEGTVDYNLQLSKKRADALALYAQQETHTQDSLWHVAGKGEDWEGLRTEVQRHPDLLKAEEVLRIIDDCDGDRDLCEERIRTLVPPTIYQRLETEMYGPLRRNEYRIEYNVRHFDLQAAKQQIKSRPELLSVEEIYTVAHSYGKGTPEYDEALLTAARTYPGKAAAVTNGACLLMEQGDPEAAIRMLEASPARNEAAVLNALGVAYARNRQYDRAKETLQQAARAGSTEAATNLEQLAGVVADL